MPAKKEEKFYQDLGMTIRLLRQTAGRNQSEVAHYLGVTFQQVQKYESGENKIPAGSLFALAEYFETSPAVFFEKKPYMENERFKDLLNSINKKEFQELISIWMEIKDDKVRAKTLNLIRDIANFSNSGSNTKAAA